MVYEVFHINKEFKKSDHSIKGKISDLIFKRIIGYNTRRFVKRNHFLYENDNKLIKKDHIRHWLCIEEFTVKSKDAL